MRKQLYVLLVSLMLIASPAVAADHSDYFDGPLNSGQEVTSKCLECHEDAADHVMKTSHWTWSTEQTINGKTVNRGKTNAINNFCVSINSNWPRCTSCHIGYGWKDASFDFNKPENVDCLVCHDGTGTYKKTPTAAGLPAETVDLLYVAKNVAAPKRENCGACHFFGGGGDAVKHGDLDSSMNYPSKEVDVHMDVDGNNFSCQSCHVTEDHQITGNAMAVSPAGQTGIGCEGCHDAAPHAESILNNHASAVACQTCHIPEFAKEHATKTSWDWSTAGQDIKAVKDEHGHPNYMKKKGHFTYGQNVQPSYAWYNGTAAAYLMGDKLDPSKTLKITDPNGDINDKSAKIYPFKVMTGKQPYDKKNNILITPKVFGKGGFWKTFDWDNASKLGMESSGLPYSGEIDFIATEMYWPINHMVSPAEKALGCLDCHGDEGRLDWKQLGYKGDPMQTGKTR
ncbi:octaheme c-type cytochrome, tetrathionate reductase family [Malonomonas rubra DSM 5091]|uniref:Octaheme c-type cytochrome, tetrathionate reductase family n=1 Tax=Malonomonas rubra DSM 5091 TaxID=1122189 RepID=A0A1M6EYD8_MALRU|nr:tetrathionate reductase family octaheme c-type cytochrome [Malonomonas rubra]SHI90435.1 octaheme c-type cytochrome, tetrathionate reductase family [Malonomonas rubra DSM 5091]